MPSSTPTRRSLREAGQEVRDLRLNRGLTPEALGDKIGVSGRTVRRIEAGARPTVRTMFALANEFEMNVTDLWL